MRAYTTFLGTAVAVLSLVSPLQASWPMARHDAKRSGATSGTSDIVTPGVYWKAFLGGAIGSNQLANVDVDGDGEQDVLLAVGGQVVAKTASDKTLWKTAPQGISGIAGVADVDGDGVLDVVATRAEGVEIFSVKTGAIEWVEPLGEMGTLGAARVGDLTGDGLADVAVVECMCCGVTSGNPGFVWAFDKGFATARKVSTIGQTKCGSAGSLTLVDIGGTAGRAILVADTDHLELQRGDGTLVATSPVLGTRTADHVCLPIDLDGSAGDELVCFLNSSNAPATKQRKVTVLRYKAPSTLEVLWTKELAPDVGGDVRWSQPIADLDGDGKKELVVSAFAGGAWKTLILDAMTGTELSSVSPAIVTGVGALRDKTTKQLVTVNGSNTSVHAFARSPTAEVKKLGELTDRLPVLTLDRSLASISGISTQVVVVDVDGDGVGDLVTRGMKDSGLSAWSFATATPSTLATVPLAKGVEVSGAWLYPGGFTVARTDGLVVGYGSKLTPLLTKTGGAFTLRAGGYYAAGGFRELFRAPRAAPLGDGLADSILVVDSRGALLRLDPLGATLATPPKPVWEATNSFAPTVVSTGVSGKQGIACLARREPLSDPVEHRVRLLKVDGTVLWDAPLDSAPLNDLVVGDFNGDATLDLAVQVANGSNLLTAAFDGTNGASLWKTPPHNPGPGGIQSAGLSVGRFKSEVRSSVYFQGAGLQVLSGASGATLGSAGDTSVTYGIPVLLDADGDGQDEVAVTGGFWPLTLHASDLGSVLYQSGEDNRPYPNPAIAKCDAETVLVQGSLKNPARLKTTILNGTRRGVSQTIVLAGGGGHADEVAARAKGLQLGQLTAASGHSDLRGTKRPTVVVGSSDGWLYAVDPCTNTLAFSLDLGAAVGEPIFGDTDGDGKDEIIVGAADGYLYGIRNLVLAAPKAAIDLDGPTGTTDVDVTSSHDSLYARWDAVADATGYEVAVVDGSGTLVRDWAATASTSASVTGLSLTTGVRYAVAVRAVGAKGKGVDAVTDGVVVVDGGDAGTDGGVDSGSDTSAPPLADTGPSTEDPPAVEGGGCGCRVGASSHLSPIALLLLLTLIGVLARRTR